MEGQSSSGSQTGSGGADFFVVCGWRDHLMIANPQLSSQRQSNSLSRKALKPFSEPVATPVSEVDRPSGVAVDLPTKGESSNLPSKHPMMFGCADGD